MLERYACPAFITVPRIKSEDASNDKVYTTKIMPLLIFKYVQPPRAVQNYILIKMQIIMKLAKDRLILKEIKRLINAKESRMTTTGRVILTG